MCMKKIKLAIKNSWKVFLAALIALVVGIIFLIVFFAINEMWAFITAAVFLFFGVALALAGWEFAKDTFHLICRDCKEVMILNSYKKPSYWYNHVSAQGKDFTFLVTIVCPHCGAENSFKQRVYGPTMVEAESHLRSQIDNLFKEKYLFEKHSHNKKGNEQSQNLSTSSEEVASQNSVNNQLEKQPEFNGEQNSGVLQEAQVETGFNTNAVSQRANANNTTKTGGLIAGMVIFYVLAIDGFIPTLILVASFIGQLQMSQEVSSDFPTATFIGMLVSIVALIGCLCLGIFFTVKYTKVKKSKNVISQSVLTDSSKPISLTQQQSTGTSANSSLTSNPDFANDLVKLNELKKLGIISEEDYQTAKENVLNRLSHK